MMSRGCDERSMEFAGKIHPWMPEQIQISLRS